MTKKHSFHKGKIFQHVLTPHSSEFQNFHVFLQQNISTFTKSYHLKLFKTSFGNKPFSAQTHYRELLYKMTDAYFWIKISLENAAEPFNFQTRMSFKKCQVAKKLKTISRTNFLESCSTFIMLTNTPYHNPSNRSTIFF